MARIPFLDRISDLTRIAHRANFSSVDKHISNLNFETRFANMVSARYSCRSFTDRKVNPAMIDKIVELARTAPSADGRQPTHVWALTSDEALARLHEVHDAYGAPAVMMVGVDTDKAWKRSYDGKSSADTDSAVVVLHMLLEASDLGLGNVWISEFDTAKMAEIFPETAGYEVTALLAVGYPADDADTSGNVLEFKPFEEYCTKL